jgi:hypothetical protein
MIHNLKYIIYNLTPAISDIYLSSLLFYILNHYNYLDYLYILINYYNIMFLCFILFILYLYLY